MTDERDPFDDFLDSLGDHDDAPPPNPRFVRALRGDLMKQAAAMPAAGSIPASDDPFRGSLSAPIPLPLPRQRRFGRRLALQLVAVAVLVLAWLGTLAGGGPRTLYNAAIQTDSSGSTASMYRGNNARTGVIGGPGPASNPRIAWQSSPAANGFVVTNANESTILLTYEDSGNIVALDAVDGRERWTFSTGCSFLSTTPLLVEELVYVSATCHDEHVGRLFVIGEHDGQERWRRDVGSGIDSSPMIADGVIYLMTTSDQQGVQALSADDGEPIWSVQIERSPIALQTTAPGATPTTTGALYIGNVGGFSPTIGDGLLFVTAFDGSIYALDTANGQEAWRFASGGNVISTPAYSGGVLYFSSSGITMPDVTGAFHALNAETGEVIWQAELPKHSPYTGPVIMDDIVSISLHSSPTPVTIAFDIGTGEERWRIEPAGSSMYADGVLYLLDLQKGNALALDPTTGQERWNAFIGNYQVSPSEVTHIAIDPVIANGQLIVASLKETVLAIESGPEAANAIASPGDTATIDFTEIGSCNPPPPVDWQSVEGEPALSLAPVNENQREGLPAAIRPDDVPEGGPVSPDIEASIGDTVAAMRACILRRGQDDVSGYFSEDFFRRTWVRVQISSSNNPGATLFQHLLFAGVESTAVSYRQLPDGRIGMDVQVEPQFSYFVAFVQQGDRWVIDELLQVTLHPEGKG